MSEWPLPQLETEVVVVIRILKHANHLHLVRVKITIASIHSLYMPDIPPVTQPKVSNHEILLLARNTEQIIKLRQKLITIQ